MAEEQVFAYDQVLYPNLLHSQTHPDRLSTMARFLGVNSKPVENCRVLELGCGTGGSLLSFALDLPDSEFIGIDLSKKEIEIANDAVEKLGYQNLKFLAADVMNVTREEYGQFDYIIAHGLYSWVPDFVRDRVLAVCGELLTEQGIAFISYNALPGCRFRQIARELMMFRAKNFSSPADKVNQGLGFLNLISSHQSEDSPYGKVLQAEVKKLSERTFESLFHDDLADFNYPLYFSEFIEHAQKHGLQFLSEVEHFPMKTAAIVSEEVRDVLDQISDDVISYEQYLDFAEGRFFRQTLLCRQGVDLRKSPDLDILRQVRISSPLKPVSESPELTSLKTEIFSNNESKIEVGHPLTKAAFCFLSQLNERSATFEELVEGSGNLLSKEQGEAFHPNEEDIKILSDMLIQVFSPLLLNLKFHKSSFAMEVSDKPQASPLVRWQIEHGHSVSSLSIRTININDPLGKKLLKLLDGTRNYQQLMDDMIGFVNSSEFDKPPELKQQINDGMPRQLKFSLQKFAEMGLLIS